MKSLFIRALAVAVLTTSLSAFAVTNDGQRADPAKPCADAKPDSQVTTGESRKEKKSKKNRNNGQKKEENSEQFLSIWG